MVDKILAEEIVQVCRKQLTTSAQFKQPRMLEVIDNEDVYNYKVKPALQGRLNVPFDGVIMAGFINTLIAQVNRPPKIEFEDPTGANLKGARKISSAFAQDSSKIKLNRKDRALKRMAALSGRGIAKYYAESDPDYCPHLDIVDHLDFHCEPNGGGHLNDHYFNGQENIFKSKSDLIKSIGFYDRDQVNKLINSYSSPDFKKLKDDFNNKLSRFTSLGLDIESNNYVGDTLFNLAEWVTVHKGEIYHVFFDRNTGIWLRVVPLKEDFSNNKTPFMSFASPQEDPMNFWNRGPADEIKPIAEAIRLNLNEILNNNRKRNWDMKAVDQNMFPDLKKLDWRQDGIVPAVVPIGQSLQNGIYRFETPEISGAINLNAYLNNLAGEKLGINAQAQGDANEDKVGIYQGNQVQISKRMKLISDSYEEMYADLGERYDWGLYDHASEKFMVRLISVDSVGWEKLTKEDKDPEYTIRVVSSSNDMAETEGEKKMKLEALISIGVDPLQMQFVNPKALVEEKFRLVGFENDKLRKLMDTKSDYTDELMSEANKAIEQILEGKNPSMNYSATVGYLRYISNYILENSDDLKPEAKAKLEKYFEDHLPIAQANEERKQFFENLKIQREGSSDAGGAPNMNANPLPAKPIPTNNGQQVT